MNTYIDAYALKEQVSLVELLRRLGHQPAGKSGGQLKYRSMIREGDNDPSFMVNPATNQWYDFGLPGGGDLITFGKHYWKDLSFYQVLQKIKAVCDLDPGSLQFAPEPRPARPRIAEKVPHYKIFAIKPLGSNPILEDYIRSRGVLDVAGSKLSEIYYQVTGDDGTSRKYFAAGWQNEYLDWEVRTAAGWKGCLGRKALSIIAGDPGKLALFEGYMDYLSWLKLETAEQRPTVIVLNSIALIGAAIRQAESFSEKTCFFDNDQPGRETTEAFLKAYPDAKDGAGTYAGYNDYNEMLTALPARRMPWEEEQVFEKIHRTYRR